MKLTKKGWIFAQTPIWAACDTRIPNGAYRLLVYLDWRQGNDECSWPAVATIARDLSIHPDTVRRRLRQLEASGYLITRHRGGRSSQYFLVADPDNASDKYTPTPRSVAGGEDASPGQPPAELRGESCSGAEGVPAEVLGGTRKSAVHDDRTEREAADRERLDEGLVALWQAVLKNLQLQMTKATFNAWLMSATARREGDTLFVQLADERALAWVSETLDGIVCRTVRRVFQEEGLAVAYEVR